MYVGQPTYLTATVYSTSSTSRIGVQTGRHTYAAGLKPGILFSVGIVFSLAASSKDSGTLSKCYRHHSRLAQHIHCIYIVPQRLLSPLSMAFIYFLHMRNAVYGILFILLNTSTTISLRINSNRHSLHTTSRSTHSDLRMASTMRDMTAFHSLQFQLLKQYQLGNWIGIQTGYAEESSDVADFMYCNEDLVLSPDESEVMHTRSLVLGEIRADCEVCFDSERLKTKVIGKYSAGNIRSRFCENVELRGPGLTPRGLSLECMNSLFASSIHFYYTSDVFCRSCSCT